MRRLDFKPMLRSWIGSRTMRTCRGCSRGLGEPAVVPTRDIHHAGLAIFVAVMGFNLLGDALRDALDVWDQ
jgi:hypothetical protein